MTYNSLPPTLCPSGIRAQIVSSLTTSPKDDIKMEYKIELPKLLGWKGWNDLAILTHQCS